MPIAVKREVCARQNGLCKCGCGQPVSAEKNRNTEFDHMPALRLRNINRVGTDYDPPQNDPRYIDARCPDSHRAKTSGTGATTAGTDTGKIKKERKRDRPPKPKRSIPSAPLQSRSRFPPKGRVKFPRRKP